ncbi:Vps5 C terminal like-domain-containing protein [Abortiporus biennis]|nr:Vps5 C terminal like-domain-containing protein [Abortiporus biennis]
MFDPLSTTFGEEPAPPWPTTPHSPHEPIPNLPRPSSRPETPERPLGANPFGKEPQIYGQPEPGLISPRITTGSNGTSYERLEPYLRVRITGLDRNRRDILVKFDAQTNLSNFTGTTYRNVSRSYTEFQQFYETIILNNPQTIIPALPLAQTSAPTDEEDDRLVRIMLQRWLSRICEDPILISEEEVRSFIESDFGYQPTPNTRRKASSGFSLIRRGVPDEDEELQKARFELTKLETQFFDAAKAIDRLAKARRSMANVRAEMGNKLVNVATTEAHPPLGNAMRKIGRAYHSLSDLDQAQAISECVIVGDSLGYQGLNARSAKETLQQRTAVLEEYQAAVKMTISKRRNIERLRASSNIRPEKVDEALQDLDEADKYEQILARRAEGISQNLHRALDRHKRLVTDDVTSALIEHVRSSIMYERQHLRELEALRNDVANANSKVVQAKAPPPRPPVIPPLEDYSKPPIPRPASGPPSNGPPPVTRSSFAPPLPPLAPSHSTVATPPSTLVPTPAASPLSPTFGSSSNVDPLLSSTSAPSHTYRQTSLPPQSPGAGPSSPSPHRAFTPPLINGPPLGGRLVDGSKSMFIKHSPSPLNPTAGPSSPLAPGPSSSRHPAFQSPLHSPSVSSPHPLAASTSAIVSPSARAANGNGHAEEGLDPLGMTKPAYMSASVRVQPTRPRLDAREAASKLANMF